MGTNDSRAGEILARLSPSERDRVALAALRVYLAEEDSLKDLAHREHVRGIIRGAAPTLGRAYDSLIMNIRRTCVRAVRHQPIHSEQQARATGRHAV